MTGTSVNSFGYEGTVTMSLRSQSGNAHYINKIHNSGTKRLFDFFIECLAGNFDIAIHQLPTKIKLLYANPDTGEIESKSKFINKLTDPVRVYNPNNTYLGGEAIRFSFVVPRALLENTPFNRIGLYADSTTEQDYTEYSAYCELDVEDTLNLWDSAAVLLIDWDLKISNMPIE